MAATTLPAPGSEFGPCVEPCAHRDCEATREMAAAACVHCSQPIGYDVRFYRVDLTHPKGLYAHARCEEAR